MSLKNLSSDSVALLSPLLQLYTYIMELRRTEDDWYVGKILTIIDSVIPEGKQNKATKDLIKGVFGEKRYHWLDLEPLLDQFAEKYCPEIENGYKEKITKENVPACRYFEFN